MSCSKCHKRGHNKRTCGKSPQPQPTVPPRTVKRNPENYQDNIKSLLRIAEDKQTADPALWLLHRTEKTRGGTPQNPTWGGRGSIFQGLPRLAQNYTPGQREHVVEWLSTLTLDDLRTRQQIHNQQIGDAARAKNPAILESEQSHWAMVTEAIDRKMFG